MATTPPLYPRWERQGRVSRFCLGPGLAVYEVKELKLIGGSLFVASVYDAPEPFIGQFETEQNARQACARDFARRQQLGKAHRRANGG